MRKAGASTFDGQRLERGDVPVLFFKKGLLGCNPGFQTQNVEISYRDACHMTEL